MYILIANIYIYTLIKTNLEKSFFNFIYLNEIQNWKTFNLCVITFHYVCQIKLCMVKYYNSRKTASNGTRVESL